MPRPVRTRPRRFLAVVSCAVLAPLLRGVLANAAPVQVTVSNAVVATIGLNFMGLQYSGPTHRAIDPMTGELADFPSAYATPSAQAALQAAGIGLVRVFVDVPRVHPSPGEFDWTDTDAAVSEIEASGMTPMLSLNQRDGAWFVGDAQQPWWTQPSGRDEWQVLAATVAQRYGDRVPYYELLNEPNHLHPASSSYMGWDASVDLFLGAAEAIHDIAPGVRVGGPASYGSWEPATWAKKVLAKPGGEQQLDFVSYHIYASEDPDDADEAIFTKAKMYETAPAVIRAALAETTSKPIEVALTEFNSSSVWSVDGVPYTDPRNVDAVGGLVASLGWLYSARGGGDMALRFGTTGGFGLIRWPPDYELLPAYHAARLLHEMGGLAPGGELLSTEITGGQSAAVEVFAIRNGDQETVILVNTHATESADVSVQFEADPAERMLDVYRYGADRLSSALATWAQAVTIDGIAQVEIAPHSMMVLRVAPAADADFDADGDVDGADFLVWQRGVSFSGNAATSTAGNADFDADVDGEDLAVWQVQFRAPPNATADAVPEPASYLLVVSGMLAALQRRGRKPRLQCGVSPNETWSGLAPVASSRLHSTGVPISRRSIFMSSHVWPLAAGLRSR